MKVYLITGGASGLGLELVAKLSADNLVIILDLKSKRLPIIAKKFGCEYHFCDISDYTAVNRIIQKYSRIDVLVNCAGIYLDGQLTDNDPDQIKRTILVNSLGPINLCRAVVPIMKKQKQGTIININSIAGLRPRKSCSVYHASKYALTGFSQSLAPELEEHNIKVTNIYPDLMATNFSKKEILREISQKPLIPSR